MTEGADASGRGQSLDQVTASELARFDYEISVRGWSRFADVVPRALCDRLRHDIVGHVQRCGELQVRAGIPGAPDGTAHHTLGAGDSLDEFLAQRFLAPLVERFFSAPYVLHAFNPVNIEPGRRNYVHRIHKDVRTYTGSFKLLLNMLVMVDDFTLENGATHILSASHHDPASPPEDLFFKHAERITGSAGSVILFDSGVWHAAGENRSARPRAALTMTFSRPFVKPQMDYARMLGTEYGAKLSEPMRQILGYNARVPVNLEEWYQPARSRMYRHDQG